MKKIKTQIKAAVCMLLAVITMISLAGCAGKFPKESDDLKEDFLIKCYTSNYADRYETFEAIFSSATEKDVDEFYACIKDLCSKDYYERLKENYTLILYDMNAHENGISMTPCSIVFSAGEANGDAETFAFIMTLDICGAEEATESIVGTITVEKNKVIDVTFTE